MQIIRTEMNRRFMPNPSWRIKCVDDAPAVEGRQHLIATRFRTSSRQLNPDIEPHGDIKRSARRSHWFVRKMHALLRAKHHFTKDAIWQHLVGAGVMEFVDIGTVTGFWKMQNAPTNSFHSCSACEVQMHDERVKPFGSLCLVGVQQVHLSRVVIHLLVAECQDCHMPNGWTC